MNKLFLIFCLFNIACTNVATLDMMVNSKREKTKSMCDLGDYVKQTYTNINYVIFSCCPSADKVNACMKATSELYKANYNGTFNDWSTKQIPEILNKCSECYNP